MSKKKTDAAAPATTPANDTARAEALKRLAKKDGPIHEGEAYRPDGKKVKVTVPRDEREGVPDGILIDRRTTAKDLKILVAERKAMDKAEAKGKKPGKAKAAKAAKPAKPAKKKDKK